MSYILDVESADEKNFPITADGYDSVEWGDDEDYISRCLEDDEFNEYDRLPNNYFKD
jgi:hypothetical protein